MRCSQCSTALSSTELALCVDCGDTTAEFTTVVQRTSPRRDDRSLLVMLVPIAFTAFVLHLNQSTTGLIAVGAGLALMAALYRWFYATRDRAE